MPVSPLQPLELFKNCDTELFDFNTTAELEEMLSPLGQERAINAVNFSVNVHAKGYNMYCLGPEGTGKTHLVRHILSKKAAERTAPSDWCYVNNFNDPHKPLALKFPAGMALGYSKDMENLVEELQVAIPAAFEGEEYRNRLQVIEEKYKDRKTEYFNKLQKKATGKNVSLLRMPVGLVVAPMRDGEVLSPEDFDKLPEDEQQDLMAELNKMQEELEDAVRDVPKWEKEQREEIRKLNEEVANYAVKYLLNDLQKKYKELKHVVSYLKEVHQDIVDNVEDFLEIEEEEEQQVAAVLKRSLGAGSSPLFRHYMANPIVRNDPEKGAPIVFSDHPTLGNIVGRVEKLQQFGALISDFNLIKAGALHEANGGFLLIDARKLLSQPFAWESLKRAIRSKEIRIETPDAESSFSTVSLDPQSIPLDIKIILIGESDLYYALAEADPDFGDLFKVEADFCSRMPRTDDTVKEYAKLIGSLSKKKHLRSLNRQAVGRVIEHSSRLAGDAEKLSAHIASIGDLIREADYWARESKANMIGRNHVEQAIEAQHYRSDRIRESMLEQIERETIMIDTDGETVGQINGLVVYELGRSSFGKPTRITCQTRIGKGEVIDIEREVDLSGPIHSKGMLILQSFLATRFAAETPLSLSASIVFEQSYGGVDGDSASSTELYALLSSLSGVPIKQSIAVTGSVNQFGHIQPIGGVNEKIEGFYDVCKKRGFADGQGVIIPIQNTKNLMLRPDIVEACANGEFTVYAVKHVDEGIEILTGLPAGERNEKNGKFPIGSINRKVEARLRTLFERASELSNGNGKHRGTLQ